MGRTEAPSEPREAETDAERHGSRTALVPPARTALDGGQHEASDIDAEDHIVRGID
ncbi:hypothetical protein [Gandjariella thermophila]|uniref:Uncharacterized protein n=1 Tax=Gandjariella thermophila TaxID=1931992 RepID=A0A4D4JC87_9PSEU|nr:hypothetical protein [Gandjariella thermophila]GDY32972.1 hypothetical protein GTS_46050 [Gandjariella thermophila]